MKKLFDTSYKNLKELVKDLKDWSMNISNTFELRNVTINYYKKEKVYVATYNCYNNGSDERMNASLLVGCKGNKKKALKYLIDHGMRQESFNK